MNITLITGLSGAGKSTVLHVFEDMRLVTADGLPPSLIPDMVRLWLDPDTPAPHGIAVGLDQRQAGFTDELATTLHRLRDLGLTPHLLYLEASLEELLRRYATTRRPHPLERPGVGLEQALREEQEKLAPVRAMADIAIDTTRFSIHDLRREVQRRWSQVPEQSHGMKVNLISFGFKYGVPKEADLIFDLRFLPNPYFVPELKALTGQSPSIKDYVFSTPEAQAFRKRFIEFLLFTLPLYEAEGRYRLTLALGCTGGRHRSVAMTECVATELKRTGFSTSIEHRHMRLG